MVHCPNAVILYLSNSPFYAHCPLIGFIGFYIKTIIASLTVLLVEHKQDRRYWWYTVYLLPPISEKRDLKGLMCCVFNAVFSIQTLLLISCTLLPATVSRFNTVILFTLSLQSTDSQSPSLLPLARIKQPNPKDSGISSAPQAEATTLLHESPNSKPETIEQRKIVLHYIRVGVAWVRIVPLVRAKPMGQSRERYVSTGNTYIIIHIHIHTK